MADIPHFIDPNSPVVAVLDTILEIAGPNFAGPYASQAQPHNIIEANQETLIQYQMPGGSQLEGHANPASGGNIGTAINSMLGLLSPAISAFALILPILGVIRGIIEILCCLMNPFCVIAAIIRLFKKWIPPFISLFPPLAGVVILASTIKAIMAIVFHIMTEIVPVIQLIFENILNMAQAFQNIDDLSQSQIDAVKIKLDNIIKTLIQKLGVLAVFLPLLELIFLILRLVAGFPCDGGKSDKENASTTSIGPTTIEFGLESDSNCCDELCPEILNFREKIPFGTGVVTASSFCEYAPIFVYTLHTNNEVVREVSPFQESREDQLNGCLDEEIKYARPTGSERDRALVRVELNNRRGYIQTFPALLIDGTNVKFVSPLGPAFLGVVTYKVIPDYDLMVMEGVMPLGCHPDVRKVKSAISARFPDITNSATENNPEAEDIFTDTVEYKTLVDDQIAEITAAVNEVIRFPDDPVGVGDGPIGEPPFDDQISRIENARDTLLDEGFNLTNNFTNRLNTIVNRNINPGASTFDVDRDTVAADASDFAIITVTPRDLTGASLLRSVPEGVGVNIEIITDLGEVFEQEFKNARGVVEAKIKSPVLGTATITVRINGELVTDFDGEVETTRTREVRFISDAELPTRRRRSKPSAASKVNTGTTSERSPGNS